MTTAAIALLTQKAEELTSSVAGKVSEIDNKIQEINQRAIDATSEVSASIADEFEVKTVSVDPVNGPYKTINEAVQSVPNGGKVRISLLHSETIEFNEGVDIGNRTVYINGGYSSMESSGLTPAVIAPSVYHSTTYNRSSLRGRFYGGPGGRLLLDYVKILLPVLIDGTSSEHNTKAAFFGGNMSVSMANYGISQNMVEVDGEGTPMFLAQCAARDRKGSLAELSLSYVKIQTCNSKPLVNLQYGAGTLNFSTYGGVFSDKNSEPVSIVDMFYGLNYGEHGYATNMLAPAYILKQQA